MEITAAALQKKQRLRPAEVQLRLLTSCRAAHELLYREDDVQRVLRQSLPIRVVDLNLLVLCHKEARLEAPHVIGVWLDVCAREALDMHVQALEPPSEIPRVGHEFDEQLAALSWAHMSGQIVPELGEVLNRLGLLDHTGHCGEALVQLVVCVIHLKILTLHAVEEL